jgi:transcription elongation regulator 1
MIVVCLGFRGGHFDRPFRPGGPDRGGWDGPLPYMSPNGGGGVHGQPDRDRPDMGGGGQIGCEPEQIWAETKTEGGSSYFYNTKSRVTSWDRPEGPNIKIMSHEEVHHNENFIC